jgi:hypothetical protein
MYELLKILLDAGPTAHPRVMEAVYPHFECVKPFFDEVSVGIVDLAAQHNSKDWSPIAELTNEKLSLGEIVFLAESSEERSCRIGAMRPKQRDVKNQLCLDIYCSI